MTTNNAIYQQSRSALPGTSISAIPLHLLAGTIHLSMLPDATTWDTLSQLQYVSLMDSWRVSFLIILSSVLFIFV